MKHGFESYWMSTLRNDIRKAKKELLKDYNINNDWEENHFILKIFSYRVESFLFKYNGERERNFIYKYLEFIYQAMEKTLDI